MSHNGPGPEHPASRIPSVYARALTGYFALYGEPPSADICFGIEALLRRRPEMSEVMAASVVMEGFAHVF